MNGTVNIQSAEIETAAICVRFSEFWIQAYCCAIVLNSIDDFTFFLISDATIVIRFSIIMFKLDCPAIISKSIVHLAFPHISQAAIVMGIGIIRLQFNRFVKARRCAVVFVIFTVSDTVSVVYFCLGVLPVCRFRHAFSRMTVCKPAVNIGICDFSVRALFR